MKKLLFMLFVFSNMIAQVKTPSQYLAEHHGLYIIVGIDVRNAIDGSKPTGGTAEIDAFGRVSFRSGHFGGSVQYENFKRIKFESWGVNLDYIDEIYIFGQEFELHSGIEGGMIIRELGKNDLFIGVNCEPRIKVFENFYLGFVANLKLRNDLKEFKNDKLIFRESVYFTIIYKFY